MFKFFKLAVVAKFRATFMKAVIVPEYKAIHWAWTTAGVYDWLLQYPAGVMVTLVNVNNAARFIQRIA